MNKLERRCVAYLAGRFRSGDREFASASEMKDKVAEALGIGPEEALLVTKRLVDAGHIKPFARVTGQIYFSISESILTVEKGSGFFQRVWRAVAG